MNLDVFTCGNIQLLAEDAVIHTLGTPLQQSVGLISKLLVCTLVHIDT